MGFFPTEGCSISAAEFTGQQKDLVQTVIDNTAFKNPVKPDIDSTNIAISNTQSILSTVTHADLPEWASLSGALNNLSTNVASYKTHSNRLSGKSLSAIGPDYEPGFMGLYGVAGGINSVKETMYEKNEDNFSPIFKSILGPSNDKLKSVEGVMTNSIQDFVTINAGVSSGSYPVGFQDKAGEFNLKISGTATSLTGMITEDNANYASALHYLEKFSLGNMIMGSKQDPCFGGNMVNRVLTSYVKEKLDGLDIF